MLVLPITGKARSDKFHLPIEIDAQNPETKELYKKTVYVKLTQARVISNKRLIRKVDVIEEENFEKIKKMHLEILLKRIDAPHCCGASRRPKP